MKVGVGYCDYPDSAAAGIAAAEMALNRADRTGSPDIALLFCTARHDQASLRDAVGTIIGEDVPIYGGGAAGVITNEYYGYAGDQVAIACIWLDGVRCDVLIERGLNEGEEATGVRLGKRLSELGAQPDSPVMLFYDALAVSEKGVRMLMATWLLEGIKNELGFLPDLTGAGLMGDHRCSPTSQWIGSGMEKFTATALAFSGDIRIDSVIMHGCRPSTGYYTVTKSEGPVILEINGRPAIEFIDELIDSAIRPEEYPFFLIFGVNHGDRWGEYDEDYYASRLCLAIDAERNGIVMFEPDMVEGTEFRLMFTAPDLEYIKPKIEKAFDDLDGREPVFAVYIDCAGRCSGYGGIDMEDAVMLQETVAGRVPVLGLYTGVEIAGIGGQPRGLDWTGVFCLFSKSKDGGGSGKRAASNAVWNEGNNSQTLQAKEASVETMSRLAEQNAARILSLSNSSIAIRCELEQKRRGFRLLADLSVSLRRNSDYSDVFVSTARRINAALNMQRTVVLVRNDNGPFTAEVLQGYNAAEKVRFAGKHFNLSAEFLDPDSAVLVTGADAPERYADFREFLGMPFFTSSPVIVGGEVFAILVTGRLLESPPYLVRLNRSDAETVQAVGAVLASVIAGQRLAASEERNRIMLDTLPSCCTLWDENGTQKDCNRMMLSLFGLSDRDEYLEKFDSLSPEYQPDGRRSDEAAKEYVKKAFVSGNAKFGWTHKTLSGELIPTEITLIRVPGGENYMVVGYIRDLREQQAIEAKLAEAKETAERYTKAKNEFLASVSHEIRTPMNAIVAMARIASEGGEATENRRSIIDHGVRATKLLTSAIETILDFSKLDSGQMSLEQGEFSVRNLIDGICHLVGQDAEAKGLYLRAAVDAGVPACLVGDAAKLQQALFGIVMNAVKFTENGGVDIIVRVMDEKDGEITINFEVRDTGIGIAEENMAALFKPLFSGDSSYSRKYEGMGMGLPVSNGLVRLMGGEITCESKPGEGCAFMITIPLAVPAAESAQSSREAATAPVRLDMDALRGLRVLVAEDNNINQMIMEELLANAGVSVTLANNGLTALDALSKGTFDIVLMDIQMPEMDGLTAASQIRADGRFDKLPILAMTANAGADHLIESMNAGMNDHLTKPVNVDQLYGALIKWSGKPELPQEL